MNVWRPHAKQEEALLSTAFETLYGGARGGGKTDCGLAWMIYEIDNPRYRGLVIRQNATDLADWVDRANTMWSGLGVVITGNPGVFKFPSGAIVYTGHLKDEMAYTKYQGHEYHRILIEELTQIPSERRYIELISSCRSTVDGLAPMVFATANPGGLGHNWVKQRFVDSGTPRVPFVSESTGRQTVFIPATVDDNPTLVEKDPDYIKFLDGLPADLKKAWRHGSWELAEVKGSIFQKEIANARKEGRIGHVEHRQDRGVYTAWDIGTNDDQVCIFIQRGEGRAINIIDEVSARDKGWDWWATMLRERGYSYILAILPHDGVKRNAKDLESFEDFLEKEGFKTKKVPRVRDQYKKWLEIMQARVYMARCYFDDNKCSHLLECLSSYRREFDEKAGIYKESPKHDWTSHCADAFRYLSCGWRDTDIQLQSKKYAKLQVEKFEPREASAYL